MLKTVMAGIAGVALLGGAAFAQDCTEEAAEEKSQELFEIVQADPSKAEDLEAAILQVEEEYGGEPDESEVCEALQKVIDLISAE